MGLRYPIIFCKKNRGTVPVDPIRETPNLKDNILFYKLPKIIIYLKKGPVSKRT